MFGNRNGNWKHPIQGKRPDPWKHDGFRDNYGSANNANSRQNRRQLEFLHISHEKASKYVAGIPAIYFYRFKGRFIIRPSRCALGLGLCRSCRAFILFKTIARHECITHSIDGKNCKRFKKFGNVEKSLSSNQRCRGLLAQELKWRKNDTRALSSNLRRNPGEREE